MLFRCSHGFILNFPPFNCCWAPGHNDVCVDIKFSHFVLSSNLLSKDFRSQTPFPPCYVTEARTHTERQFVPQQCFQCVSFFFLSSEKPSEGKRENMKLIFPSKTLEEENQYTFYGETRPKRNTKTIFSLFFRVVEFAWCAMFLCESRESLCLFRTSIKSARDGIFRQKKYTNLNGLTCCDVIGG